MWSKVTAMAPCGSSIDEVWREKLHINMTSLCPENGLHVARRLQCVDPKERLGSASTFADLRGFTRWQPCPRLGRPERPKCGRSLGVQPAPAVR